MGDCRASPAARLPSEMPSFFRVRFKLADPRENAAPTRVWRAANRRGVCVMLEEDRIVVKAATVDRFSVLSRDQPCTCVLV